MKYLIKFQGIFFAGDHLTDLTGFNWGCFVLKSVEYPFRHQFDNV